MENRKSLKFQFIIFLMGIIFIPFFNVYAYDDKTTHPALTQEIIKLFEYHYPQYEFTASEKELIEKGSIEEDFPIYRSLFHFYDPIYEEGFNGNLSAKKWAQNTRIQALLDPKYTVLLANIFQKLFESGSDFSFDRAIYDYIYGDKERALINLGHILHLIEDMSVPPHTRNDSHALGSPYENYAKQFIKENIDITSNLIKNQEKVIIYDNLDDYFYNLALFSNNNFFSQDTILDEKYAYPVIDYEKIENIGSRLSIFGYNQNKNKLLEIERKRDYKTGEMKTLYSIEDDNLLILSDYWKSLSKQAILHGAGVMKLFFDAVEEEKETLALFNKNQSGFEKTLANLKEKIINPLSKIANYVNKQDMTADIVNLDENIKVEDDFEVEVFQHQPQNHHISIENSDTQELKELALILEEAEKMVVKLEKDINIFLEQNIEEVKEELIIEKLIVDNVDDNESEENISTNTIIYGGGGGSGNPVDNSNIEDIEEGVDGDIIEILAPQITSPSDFSQAFTATTINFSGTASSTQIISTDFSNATTTVDSDNTWELTLSSFNQGTTTINFYADDNQGNISSSTPITLNIFLPAPDISLEIIQCDNSMTTNSCLIATTTLDILWSSTALNEDLSHFNINKNNEFSTTTATSTQVIDLIDGEIYTFSISVMGTNGNSSATSTQTVIVNTLPIIINEIAWRGTTASTTDEWIELYNRSDEDIDLSDWILYTEDLAPFLTFDEANDKIIEANSYYLIERTEDDTTISDITADLATPFSGLTGSSGLENSGEHLILAYKQTNQATTTIDEVPFGDGWPTGDATRSLEKYNPDLLGTDVDNWSLSVPYTASQDLLNGLDVNGNIILGTPKARNSINYKIAMGDTLDTDKTLNASNSPYYIGTDGLTIQTGKTLTIEEGVIIKTIRKYGDAQLLVDGTINANGSVEDPIIFTFFGDDEGGDTNGDGVCVSGVATTTCPGEFNNYWSQVILTSNSENSIFNNVIFRYGGYRLGTYYPEAMVILEDAIADFTNTSFENSKTSGLDLVSSTSTIENCDFENNKQEMGYYGLHALNSGLDIQNSNFDNNQIGLYLSDSVGANINSNIFTNNNDYALKISGSPNIQIENNQGSDNNINAIEIFGYITNEIATTILAQNPLPYIIDRPLVSSPDTVLDIEAGTVFKFDDGGYINIGGQLNVNGSEGNEVLFTSVYDDSDGVDIFNDGSMATSSIPKEGSINILSATSTIQNAEFNYLYMATKYQNTGSFQSPIDLKNIIFKHNTWSILADEEDTPVNRAENIEFIGIQSMSSLSNWP